MFAKALRIWSTSRVNLSRWMAMPAATILLQNSNWKSDQKFSFNELQLKKKTNLIAHEWQTNHRSAWSDCFIARRCSSVRNKSDNLLSQQQFSLISDYYLEKQNQKKNRKKPVAENLQDAHLQECWCLPKCLFDCLGMTKSLKILDLRKLQASFGDKHQLEGKSGVEKEKKSTRGLIMSTVKVATVPMHM